MKVKTVYTILMPPVDCVLATSHSYPVLLCYYILTGAVYVTYRIERLHHLPKNTELNVRTSIKAPGECLLSFSRWTLPSPPPRWVEGALEQLPGHRQVTA